MTHLSFAFKHVSKLASNIMLVHLVIATDQVL